MTETSPPPPGEPTGDATGDATSEAATVPAGEPDPAAAYAAYGFTDGPAAPSGRRGLAIGAIAAVLAVVAGAAVYATTALSGGGRQPDELVPKATFAYLKVDLDPAASQKLAARSFFGRFPKFKGATNDTDRVFDSLLQEAFTDAPDVDFANDVKPWFDRRAAVAAFPGSSGAAVVAVVRSKDDAKARAALDRVAAKAKADGTTVAYTIAKGYVVLSDRQASVDDAVRLSGQASLRDNTTYRGDVARLDGDQVVVGWADLQPAFRAGTDVMSLPGILPGGLTDLVKGRVVAGLHLTNDYAEVQGLTIGLDQRLAQKAGDPTVLKGLPASTVAAVSFNDLGGTIRTGLAGAAAGGIDPLALLGGFLGQTGVSLEDDLLPLLGSQTVLVLGRAFTGLDSIRAGVVTRVDAPNAAASGQKAALALEQLGVPVKARVKDDTFYLATGDYVDELANGGGLGASPKFIQAMGDAGSVSFAAYADLEALLAGPDASAELKPLRAFGLVGGVRDGEQFFRARLVVA